jgi:hypothetical protein
MVPGFETWQKILLKCGANAGSGLQGNLIRANFFLQTLLLVFPGGKIRGHPLEKHSETFKGHP